MSQQLSKNFEPKLIEEAWYKHWVNKGYFSSVPDERKPFTVVIPPPNVTGVLHMGHTLNETVQDVLVRKARMSGFNACWVPGTDHASIATEAKVVQMLQNEKGLSKHDIGREEFLRYAYEWKQKYGGIIYHQLAKLGCSVNWENVTFTMDDHYYHAVIKVFVDLYNKNLIYRGARMINWDPAAKTALSDEEVEYKDIQGKLYYIKYKIAGEQNQFVAIATQRPETIMGDTAICVHPNDARYAFLKNKKVIVPLVNREVPVIFDEYVDPSFGTGALKITPAHDINDYNLGLKYGLPAIETINEDGTLSEAAEIFVGLDRFEARKKIIEQLYKEDLLIKEEEYATRIGFSQRTNAVVEPRISTQWFVKMHLLAEQALEAVMSGEVKIHPEERFIATYKYWLENVRDWCISRQLWWGQRIPAWYDVDGRMVVAESKEAAIKEFQKTFKVSHPELKQDDDVLDTWFSSWLWPIEVFHGITDPGNKNINYYYPTSVLVTGQDIIFFWVARMIMAGMEYMKEKPFEHVYFTGMVRDKQGRKMSKSLGNSPDLLDLIDRFGADAVRFGILISAPAGNDLLFDDSSCEQGRNFNNKLWNALRLVSMWKERTTQNTEENKSASSFAVTWFRNRLHQAHQQIDELYTQFRLSEALKIIYSLIWDDFCSWYLEWIKPAFEQEIAKSDFENTVEFFSTLMQLLHPFMPFITEQIYHELKEREEGDDLCVRQFGIIETPDILLLEKGEILKQLITDIRDTRIKNNIKQKTPIQIFIQSSNNIVAGDMISIISKQTNAEKIEFVTENVPDSFAIVTGKVKTFILTDQPIDTTAQKQQLEKELEYYKGFLNSVDKKLSNQRFVQNAKEDIVNAERKKKADAEEKIKMIQESLKTI